MNALGFNLKKKLILLLVAVGILALLSLGKMQAQADLDEPIPDLAFELSQVPDCSYGYGQCRQGCFNFQGQNGPLGQVISMQRDCLGQCQFLYADCREI